MSNPRGNLVMQVRLFVPAVVVSIFLFTLFQAEPTFAQSNPAVSNVKEEAVELFMENKPAEAAPMFETLLRQEPSNVDFYLYLATCYEQLGNINAALQTYEEGLSNTSGNKSKFYYNMGNLYQKKESYDQAVEMYDKALSADSSFSSAYLNRANVNVRQSDYSEAVADYRVFLSIEPNSPQRANIEKMISLLNNKILLAEQKRREEEQKRKEEEARQEELLKQVLDSLEKSGSETQNLSAGTGEVKEHQEEFDIVD